MGRNTGQQKHLATRLVWQIKNHTYTYYFESALLEPAQADFFRRPAFDLLGLDEPSALE
jgi:hypothetical protein